MGTGGRNLRLARHFGPEARGLRPKLERGRGEQTTNEVRVPIRYLAPVLILVLSLAAPTAAYWTEPPQLAWLATAWTVGLLAAPVLYVVATAWLVWSISTPRDERRAIAARRLALLALAAPPAIGVAAILVTAEDVMWNAVPILVAPLLLPLTLCAWGFWRLARLEHS